MATANIQGINRAELLLALYNRALPEGENSMQSLLGGNIEDTNALVQDGDIQIASIDLGAGSRELNIGFRGDQLDYAQYDDLYGAGTARNAINAANQGVDYIRFIQEVLAQNPPTMQYHPQGVEEPGEDPNEVLDDEGPRSEQGYSSDDEAQSGNSKPLIKKG